MKDLIHFTIIQTTKKLYCENWQTLYLFYALSISFFLGLYLMILA